MGAHLPRTTPNGEFRWQCRSLVLCYWPLDVALYLIALVGVSHAVPSCSGLPFLNQESNDQPPSVIQEERYEEARAVLTMLQGSERDEDSLSQELAHIREQIQAEATEVTSFHVACAKLFSRRYLHRTLIACFIVVMGQFSGSQVIQNYQTSFYETVGFTGRTSLLISGVYGFMGVIGQIIYLFVVADKWPRTRTLWTGSLFLSILIAICMALSAVYGDASGGDLSGARAAIAMIFLYSCAYAVFFNAMVWVVPSELFPFFLRSTGLGLAVFSKSVAAIVLSQITPTAFVAAFIYFFFLPETGGKTLEQIAELFGDPPSALSTGVKTEDADDRQSMVEAKDIKSTHVEAVV